jgi:hypothetical protein
MRIASEGSKTKGKTARRIGSLISMAGSAAVGSSLAFDGVGGCPRLLQEYLGYHNFAVGMFLVGGFAVAVGVYLQVVNRVRRAPDTEATSVLANA